MPSTGYLNATRAKKEYFLTSHDLSSLDYETYGGWGAGNTRLYDVDDLERAALAKHGRAGLAAKREKRARREESKRQKEAAAKAAEAELLNSGSGRSPTGVVVDLTGSENNPGRANVVAPSVAATTPRSQHPAVDSKSLKNLRDEIRRSLKAHVSYNFLRSKNSEHGATATVRLPRIEQIEYCTLIGRPADPDLRTLVKSGAWYACSVPFHTVFGSDAREIRGSGGRYNCNRELGIDPDGPLTVKYCPSNKTLSVSAFVCHEAQFGNYY